MCTFSEYPASEKLLFDVLIGGEEVSHIEEILDHKMIKLFEEGGDHDMDNLEMDCVAKEAQEKYRIKIKNAIDSALIFHLNYTEAVFEEEKAEK